MRFLYHIRGDPARSLYIDPAGCESPFRNHAYPILGHRSLGAVRRSEIQGG